MIGGPTGVLMSEATCSIPVVPFVIIPCALCTQSTHFGRVAAVRTSSKKKKYAILNVLNVYLSESDLARNNDCTED